MPWSTVCTGDDRKIGCEEFPWDVSFCSVVPFNGSNVRIYSHVGFLYSRCHFTLTVCCILKLGKAAFFLKHALGPIAALYIRTKDSGPKV